MKPNFLFTALLSLFLLACSSDKVDTTPTEDNTEVVSDSTALNNSNYTPEKSSSSKTEDLNVKTTIELPNIFSVLRGIL